MNSDKKLMLILIGLLLILLLSLFLLRGNISSMFQDIAQDESGQISISRVRVINAVFMLFLACLFSYLGYKKAIEKKLEPLRWAIVCFIFNFWGYIFLLIKKPGNT
jgi:uncharacterized BrkB/YihY/UPF0761 family membrane protein